MPEPQPVELVITQACHFKAKPCATCGLPRSNALHRKKNAEEGKPYCDFKRKLGCARCGLAKKHRDHMGAPPSLNVLGSGDQRAYIGMKDQWQEALTELLEASGLPRGLGRVTVEGEVTFPDRREDRDQGNFRVVLEKALGDALERGGWIERDDWTRYEFGGLACRHERGVSRTRLILFPAAVVEREPALFAAAG